MDSRVRSMIIMSVIVFMISAIYFTYGGHSFAMSTVIPNEGQLGEICIRKVSTAARIENNKLSDVAEHNEQIEENDNKEEKETKEIENSSEEKATDKWFGKNKLTDDPLVIIYHTHSSESYMPYKASNYHREEEKGTVREVGDVLEAELEKEGINVIHDKTIHDRPSYNESYTKSLATIQSLVKKYPTATYIIDLHRDAAASSATEGKYTVIDGERVAKFSMVVGQANENYVELYDFAKRVGSRAGEMYEGFSGAIIEKNYNYNEFLSNNALLLEVGNNKNTIEEANVCGKYFAHVLASIIKEEYK